MHQVLLELKPVPDTYGFIYGQARRGDQLFDVNVLPPLPHWCGQFKLDGYVPDQHDWIIYVDGEEVARVQALVAVEAAIRSALE